jgi:hypothetical protein
MCSLRKLVLVAAALAVVAAPFALAPTAAEANDGEGVYSAYLWSVELHQQNPQTGEWSLFARYFVTADYYGNVLDWGGLDYGWNAIVGNGWYAWYGNSMYVRQLY